MYYYPHERYVYSLYWISIIHHIFINKVQAVTQTTPESHDSVKVSLSYSNWNSEGWQPQEYILIK